MVLDFIFPRWFKKNPPLLVLQTVGGALRFMLRRDDRIVKSGFLPMSTQSVHGRMFDVAAVRNALLRQVGDVAGEAAILLPTAGVHIHYLDIPNGLDRDESEYQVVRHITHDLGLSLADVYYDWTRLKKAHGQTLLLAVARQTEVAQYAQLLNDTQYIVRWVCVEPLVWGHFCSKTNKQKQTSKYVVCQIEQDHVQLFWMDAANQVKAMSKRFGSEQMSGAGFEYISGDSYGAVQLPLRFIINEVDAILNQALGDTEKHLIHGLYVFGAGANWSNAAPQFQSHFGVPVWTIQIPESAGQDPHLLMGGLWQLTEQILKERR